ncbi:hypothetical protein CHS0354_017367 [Potamilus streckersoni]|uniref:Sodium-dependent glucose transporter 1 n=1 Tax=Potamilus streckersoni TaxID=2493646 RepID=A0AAE0T4L2_9BIVA|nr:hypothetical protein CHS0354_017367 [Potamilus streckersoni]
MTGKPNDERQENHVTGNFKLHKDQEETSFIKHVDGEVETTEATLVKDASINSNDRTGVIQKIRLDTLYRSKFLLTVWICISCIVMGLFIGHTGPAFPDLRLIVNKDLSTSSWLLTAWTTGYLAGSLIYGVLYDKFNRLLVLFLMVMGMSLAGGIAPWCSLFPLMVTMRAISGACVGGLDAGANAMISAIWGVDGRPYMQTLHFAYAFGGIISPLITEPFLAPKRSLYEMAKESLNGTENISFANISYTSVLPSCSNSTNCTIITDLEYWGETKVQYAYMISTIIGILSAISFLVSYLQRNSESRTKEQQEAHEDSRRISTQISNLQKIGVVILLMLLFHVYGAVEDTFASYLMTFSLLHLNWTKLKGSLATTVYWASFGFGRFSGIFIVRLLHPTKMLFLYCSFMVISLASFTVGSVFLFNPIVWIFCSLIGLALSVIFPTMVTWTEESVMPVSGKIASLFVIAGSSGTMLNPLYLGYLMENKSPLWFPYLLLGQSIICLLMFVILFICTKTCIKRESGTELEIYCQKQEEEQENLNSSHA